MTEDNQLDTQCHWVQEGNDDNTWESDCGNTFCINDGTPKQNDLRFCPFCGLPLVEVVSDEQD